MKEFVFFDGDEVGRTTFVDSALFGIADEDYVTVAILSKRLFSAGAQKVIVGFDGEYLEVSGREITPQKSALRGRELFEELVKRAENLPQSE